MSANALTGDDPRFTWDTHWAGDFDFVDYVLRPPDRSWPTTRRARRASSGPSIPYQSNYTLEASASLRRATTECALRVPSRLAPPRRSSEARRGRLERARLARILKRIERRRHHRRRDGRCRTGGRARVRGLHLDGATSTSWRAVRSRRASAFYGRGFGETYRRRSRRSPGRGQQWGGRFEAGVRLGGHGRRARAVRRLRTDDRRRSARPACPARGRSPGFG